MTPRRQTPGTGGLRKRRLGRTGLLVSEVGVGGANLTADDSGEEALLTAFALGVDFVETGRLYRGSEYLIGGALAQAPNKSEVIVASKTLARSRDGALADLERSLHHLRLQAIDIYQLAGVGAVDWPQVMSEDGALRGLQEARRRGMVRFIGISSHSLRVLRRAVESGEFDTLQVKWGAFHPESARLIDLAYSRDVGVIGMKPFGGFGMFGSLKDSGFEKVLTAKQLLRYVLANPHVSVSIPGVRRPVEARENVETAASSAPLTSAAVTEIGRRARDFLSGMR
jgi:aryl-alcohol dehydrogenase-like predicted oxidoreductase